MAAGGPLPIPIPSATAIGCSVRGARLRRSSPVNHSGSHCTPACYPPAVQLRLRITVVVLGFAVLVLALPSTDVARGSAWSLLPSLVAIT